MTNTTNTTAWTWSQTVATTGTGPTATVEIDVRVPGHREPEPVVVPLADARVLHAMLGDAIREVGEGGDTIVEQPAPVSRAAIRVEAFQEAAEKLAGLDPAKAALAGGSAWKTAAGVVRHMAVQERRMADGEQPADGPSRVADEAQQPETGTLAAALDGIHGLIATSSRDWGTYRVDAWLWAVLCGWDCEQDEHDETCTHGAMEEMAELHGWDDDTVAKARRYRAAVRAVTESVATQPGGELCGVHQLAAGVPLDQIQVTP